MVLRSKADSVGEFAASYMGIDPTTRTILSLGSLLKWYCVLLPYMLVGAELAALTTLSPGNLILYILLYMQYVFLVFVTR